jgi:hypothetical protein
MAYPDEFPWSADARKLQLWFLAFLILLAGWIIGLVLPLPNAVMPFVVLLIPAALVVSIGCVVYAYRVQSCLERLRFSATGAWVVAVGAIVLGPFLVAVIASMIIRSHLKRITRDLEDGSLVLPAESEIARLLHQS